MQVTGADSAWLAVLGMGEEGLAGLSAEARALLGAAERVIGGARHLALLGTQEDATQERIAWPSPITDLLPRLAAWRGRPTAVLATGDPLCYGVATLLLRHFGADELRILPHLSAFTLARARLGWSRQGVIEASLHGRSLSGLRALLGDGARLLLLAHDENTPQEVAALLTSEEYGASEITVLEHMGGANERIRNARAEALAARPFADVSAFHTLAVRCVAGEKAQLLARGLLPDDSLFAHDGQMTKFEVRQVALAKLQPSDGALLWDLGAGCGSVAISWLRLAPDARAIAVERNAERGALARKNAERLGVPRLVVAEDAIADFLDRREGAAERADRARPNAIFIGGGLRTPNLAARALARLAPGGRLVAHAVTLESEAVLSEARAAFGGTLTRLAVWRADSIGPYHGWRGLMPVTQWACTKPRARGAPDGIE